MTFTSAQTTAISIIGINIDTSFIDQKDALDIKALWERWFAEQISNIIPNKTDQRIYNVYHNYQDENRGDYSVLLGHEVSSLDTIPDGLVGLSFQPGFQVKYEINGPLPDAVIQAWKDIHSCSEYHRTYIADYDVYDFSDNTQEAPKVHTYVSILKE